MTPNERRIFDDYNATGRIAHLFPRHNMISLNGFPRIPLKEAIIQMIQCLDRHPTSAK